VASFLVPILGAAFSTSARYAVEAFTGPRRPVNELLWYATHVYLGALTFIAIPYVPQFLVAARLDEIAVGTYGLILTFTAPVSLLVYSLRSVLLPKMLQPGVQLEELLWSRRGFFTILCSWAVLSAGGILVASALQLFYGHKFPGIGLAFAAFFIGFSGTAMVGFYSLSTHTLAVPHLSTGIGLIKFVVLLGLLALFGRTLLETVVLTGFVMFAGEVALALTLGARRRKAAT
jgi:O-antigen/teichoic acid export membrane protein